jgi:hypothetical protein
VTQILKIIFTFLKLGEGTVDMNMQLEKWKAHIMEVLYSLHLMWAVQGSTVATLLTIRLLYSYRLSPLGPVNFLCSA